MRAAGSSGLTFSWICHHFLKFLYQAFELKKSRFYYLFINSILLFIKCYFWTSSVKKKFLWGSWLFRGEGRRPSEQSKIGGWFYNQLAICICGSTSTDSANRRLCRSVLWIYWKKKSIYRWTCCSNSFCSRVNCIFEIKPQTLELSSHLSVRWSSLKQSLK